MLFADISRTDDGPGLRSEPQYSYLNRSARPDAARIRALLEEWFTHYPVDARSAFISAFQSIVDTQFIAAWFELYLHELLRRLGYTVTVHPENPSGKSSRPDFLAVCPAGNRIYVEAVLATDVTDAERSAEARMNVVYDALNRLGPTDFFLGMEMDGSPETPPPAKRLRAALATWLAGLNADAVAEAIEVSGSSAVPRFNFEYHGWRIEFTANPKSPVARGKLGVRPIGIQLFGAKMISTWTAVRDAVVAKGARYGELPEPLVVAVNVGGFSIDKIDIMQALFGQEQFLISSDHSDADPTMARAPNGAWTSPTGPRYRRISAVLVAADLLPWSVAMRCLRLYHNPWAHHRCSGLICSLPQCVPEGDEMRCHDGIHPRNILGLAEGWPY